MYERYEETHRERTYPIDVYKKLLLEAGFSEVQVSADFTEEVHEESRRWFFACTK
ncbi:MAG: hypothetical protein U5K84_01670 [Alkalibacterium sp.]|nr:hypothetical protein [Alkalibacterium sp.]